MRLLRVRTCVVALFAAGLASAGQAHAVLGNDNGLDTSQDTIVAGVQFGRPPSAKGKSDSNGCIWVPAGEAGTFESAMVDERVVNGVTQHLFLRSCPTSIVGVWVSQPKASTLGQAGASLVKERLPKPRLGSAPTVTDGVVKVGMWLWADAAQYQPISVTAWVPTPDGIIWARTTARPVGLVFQPGEPGGVPVRCSGPGTVWQPRFGDDAVSACMYTYQHSSEIAGGHFNASWSIVWNISWRSNVAVGQNLGEYSTTTDVDVAVREIQALIVG
jgi:hypothetical protein